MPPEPLAQGEVVSWFQLKSLSNGGDNGWFRIDNGWVLQSWLTIHVQGKPFSGTSWQLTVQTVPVTPSLLCNTSG